MAKTQTQSRSSRPAATVAPKGNKGADTKKANAPSARPGTEDASGKGNKKARSFHPSLLDDDGKPTKKLDAYPEDFDSKQHKPLKKGNFEDETVWMLHQADVLEGRAKKIREDVELIRKTGGKKAQAKVKKLLAIQNKLAQLESELSDEGVDVEALLASFDETDDE